MQNYFKRCFFSDLRAGFITSVVALPLAIAFALASGVPAEMGLYTAVIAGVLASLCGGSKFSITGPTGAMTVIILSTVSRFGIEGLLLAGFLAGVMQVAFGLFRLGGVVKFIPLPVVSGFTGGIGVIIFFGQLPNALGLKFPPKEHIWETIGLTLGAMAETNFAAVAITFLTLIALLFLPKLFSKIHFTRSIPVSIVALVTATWTCWAFGLSVPLVGEVPHGVPRIEFLKFNLTLVRDVLPAAFTIALLGAIEALLCAVVCDAMTSTRHNSNRELFGQGIANLVLPFFGGMAATAAIARSAINIREGARTQFAGVYHALFLFAAFAFFAPLAELIPKPFLAGMLLYISARMINIQEFRLISKISRSDAAVLFLTFALTALTDLVFAVQVGMICAIFLLFVRMVQMVNVSSMENYDDNESLNELVKNDPVLNDNVALYTIHGPLFFGAMGVFDRKVGEHIAVSRPVIVLRMKFVPFIDTTGTERLRHFVSEREQKGSVVLLSSAAPQVLNVIRKDPGLCWLVTKDRVFPSTRQALAAARGIIELNKV